MRTRTLIVASAALALTIITPVDASSKASDSESKSTFTPSQARPAAPSNGVQILSHDPMAKSIGAVRAAPIPVSDPKRARPAGSGATRAARGSFSLDFFPNGDGVEVDLPTDILYSPDGQYLLVAALGTSPGTANLSVYDASNLAFVRAIPLTFKPFEMAVMSTQPRVLITNFDDNKVTIVDYLAGTELAAISVGDRPAAIAVSPDDSFAVVQSGILDWLPASWSVIDLSTNTESKRFESVGCNGSLFINQIGHWLQYHRPILLSGNRVATMSAHFDSLMRTRVAIVDLNVNPPATTLIPIASADIMSWGGISSSADGTMLAVSYSIFSSTTFAFEVFVTTVNTTTLATNTYALGLGYVSGYTAPLLKADGSKVAMGDDSSLYIIDTTTHAVTPVDVSGFSYGNSWKAGANVNGGTHFAAWLLGAGDFGYQIFDWNGVRTNELVVADLPYGDDIITNLYSQSPTDDSLIAFVDPMMAVENLIVVDLNPASPSVLASGKCGDAVEGDGLIDLIVSDDQSTALVANHTSRNAGFLNLSNMQVGTWTDVPKFFSDATMTPDGSTAAFATSLRSGAPTPLDDDIVLLDRISGLTTTVPLPAGKRARAVSASPDSQYIYTLLSSPAGACEVARMSTATGQMDPIRLPVPFNLPFVPYIWPVLSSDIFRIGAALNDDRNFALTSHDGEILAVASSDAVNYSTGMITLIDTSSWSVITTVPVGVEPVTMLFSPDDARLYVGGQSDVSVIEIDGQSSTVLSRPNGGMTVDFALSNDGTKLYAGRWVYGDAPIVVFNALNLNEITTIAPPVLNNFGIPFFDEFSFPTHLKWSADGSTLYCFAINGDVHAINPSTNAVTASFDTGFHCPSDVIRLNQTVRGAEDRFLLSSYNDHNDGLAILTIEGLPCSADLAGGDGVVDVFDLFELLSNWNIAGPGADLALPNDVVDVFDLFALLSAWGPCP